MMPTSSDAISPINYSKVFYQFLGIHSLLIGVFPFFAPVFLWDDGYSLTEVSFFISLSGLGFCVGLWCWDRLIRKISLFALIVLSFVLEVLLLFSVGLSGVKVVLVAFALCYGIYNCFFWTTQRALFYTTLKDNNSGRKFGNFQIFVAAILQIGILIGGVLLEQSSLIFIYLCSMSICLAAIIFFFKTKDGLCLPKSLLDKPVLSCKQLIEYKDEHRSRSIFLLDGLFLFMESFFWLITLFMLAHESFWKLGVVVILLSIVFFIIFIIIKNTIDQIATHLMYKVAVVLYALSWLLRGFVDNELPLFGLFVLLVLITFCTSYFRLAFNKRFYDLAKLTTAQLYLIKKSYYSQAFIFLVYGLLGLVFWGAVDAFSHLQWLYWLSAPMALYYFCYGLTLKKA